jgi:hypothetical protein
MPFTSDWEEQPSFSRRNPDREIEIENQYYSRKVYNLETAGK